MRAPPCSDYGHRSRRCCCCCRSRKGKLNRGAGHKPHRYARTHWRTRARVAIVVASAAAATTADKHGRCRCCYCGGVTGRRVPWYVGRVQALYIQLSCVVTSPTGRLFTMRPVSTCRKNTHNIL